MASAISKYNKVKSNGNSVQDAHKFLKEYKAARTAMLEYGLLDDRNE